MKQRPDAIGLFWSLPPKVEKKTEPPKRTWEETGYLPYFDEAKAFNVSLFTLPELLAAQARHEVLIFDCEIYINYFLAAFTSLSSGKVIYFETRDSCATMDLPRLRWILENFKIITFNGNDFDLPMLSLALEGLNTSQLKHASSQIINQQVKPWIVLRSHKLKQIRPDHIDLIEVAPLQASLKIYGGRLHVPKMQELPFRNEIVLTEDQITVVRWYCINSDLTATAFLYMELKPQLELRESMSAKYGTDLRSKSDAQIAEAVISSELYRLTQKEAVRPEIAEGTVFKYQKPAYINFKTKQLQDVLDTVVNANFVINEHGSPVLPKEISDLQIKIGGSTYQMGLGGLHSCETCVAHYSNSEV